MVSVAEELGKGKINREISDTCLRALIMQNFVVFHEIYINLIKPEILRNTMAEENMYQGQRGGKSD